MYGGYSTVGRPLSKWIKSPARQVILRKCYKRETRLPFLVAMRARIQNKIASGVKRHSSTQN